MVLVMKEEKGKTYYQRKIRQKTEGTAWMSLPDPEWSLTPDWAVFYDDISNHEQFNERFIESRVAIGGMASALKLFAFMFFFLVVSFLWGGVSGEIDFSDKWMVVIACSSVLVFGIYFYLAFTNSKPAPVRFNRQAQLVHVTTLPKRDVVTVPWKDVQPFIHFDRDLSGWYNLKLLFPYRQPDRNSKRDDCLEVPGLFSTLDNTFLTEAVTRWEFIRSYMEGGLESIQPDKKAQERGDLNKLSGFTKEVIAGEEHLTTKLWYLIEKILVFPVYLERLVKKREADFRWPEEVERLCAPDADLSNLDTRPITSNKHMHYLLDEHKGIVWGTAEEFRAAGRAVKRSN